MPPHTCYSTKPGLLVLHPTTCTKTGGQFYNTKKEDTLDAEATPFNEDNDKYF